MSNYLYTALGKATSRIRGALKRTPRETKDEYRQFYFPSDVTQARIVLLGFAIALALFGVTDYPFLGLSLHFYVLEALRLSMTAYSLAQFFYVNRVKDYHSYDRSLIVYLLAFVLFSLLVNSTRPQDFMVHVIIAAISIFVFYLVIPTRFAYQALLSTIYTIGEIFLVITIESFMQPALFGATFSLIFANAVAAISSWQLHSYRWRIFQNVAERKETERLVAIGQTAGMIGHDIRNPLQAIVSELYLARGEMANSPHIQERERALESIQLIEEQTDYISKIVSDLQDYARPIKPEYSQVDLSELIVSVFQTVSLPEKITLKVDVKGFPKIRSDPTLIRRALTNLVNNAIQAMPDGGNLQLTATKTDNQAVITVSDTGKGIPEEIKPKLFTPLTTTKAKGQGLGLAVVKRLVEALNGKIAFESQEGKGTTFIISLPV